MQTTTINRNSWHYRFITSLLDVKDSQLTDTCVYKWKFLQAIISLAFIGLICLLIAGVIIYMFGSLFYGIYLMSIGAIIPEVVFTGLFFWALIFILCILVATAAGVSKLKESTSYRLRQIERGKEEDNGLLMMYHHIKNKTCAKIEFVGNEQEVEKKKNEWK